MSGVLLHVTPALRVNSRIASNSRPRDSPVAGAAFVSLALTAAGARLLFQMQAQSFFQIDEFFLQCAAVCACLPAGQWLLLPLLLL